MSESCSQPNMSELGVVARMPGRKQTEGLNLKKAAVKNFTRAGQTRNDRCPARRSIGHFVAQSQMVGLT